jgi:uncharacterized phage infection (PIP) family protein YhgE
MSLEMEAAVSPDTASATVDTTSTPDSAVTDAPDSGTQDKGGAPASASKSYSEDQVQQTIRARLEQQKRSYEKRLAEFQKKHDEYEKVIQRANAGIEAMGRGFGFIQDEPPKPVGQEDIQSLRAEFDKRFEQHQQQLQREQIVSQLKTGWAKVESSMPEFSKVRGFQRVWAEYQAESLDKDPVVIAKEIASDYEKIFASRANAAAEKKDEIKGSAAIPRAAPATGTPSKADEKVPLRHKLAAALKASRE